MKETLKYGLIVGFTITTLGFILFQTIPETLIKMFNSNEELVSIGVDALKTISLAFPIVGLSIVGSTTLQAVGRGFASMIVSFLRQIIVLLPVAYLLGKSGGLSWVWYSFPISEAISFVILIFLFRNIFVKIIKDLEEKNLAKKEQI